MHIVKMYIVITTCDSLIRKLDVKWWIETLSRATYVFVGNEEVTKKRQLVVGRNSQAEFLVNEHPSLVNETKVTTIHFYRARSIS